MYDMYPEWGPARNNPESPYSTAMTRSRPRLTCETTAASAPTTTSIAAHAHHPSKTSLKLAVIPGDGIGPEVTAEGLKVLEQATPPG